MKLLIMLLGLSGCAACAPHTQQVIIPSDFQTQVEAFQQAAESVGSTAVINDLVIEFSTSLNEANGECDLAANATPVIKIDQATWAGLDDIGKEVVIFHELGHCVLGRPHNPATFSCPNSNIMSGQCPKSIMNPAAGQFESVFEDVYKANRTAYVQELLGLGSGPQ